SLTDGDAGLVGSFEYSRELFDQATISRMARHVITLMESVVADPDRPISDVAVLPSAERHQVLEEWSRGPASVGKERMLHELVELQVHRRPGALAVVGEGQALTYAELDERANKLAHHLRRLGVGPEVVVGLHLERSVEAVVAVLGILKAGGAYLPL